MTHIMLGVFLMGKSSMLWRFDSAQSIRQTGIHKLAFSKNYQKSYNRNIFILKIVLRRAWKDAFNELSYVYVCLIWKFVRRPLPFHLFLGPFEYIFQLIVWYFKATFSKSEYFHFLSKQLAEQKDWGCWQLINTFF